MKSKEVLSLLRITRPTLTKYVKSGLIGITPKHNGQYDYDEKSVYALLNKNVERKTYIYSRVSTSKQKSDLQNQIDTLKGFCFSNSSFDKTSSLIKLFCKYSLNITSAVV